MGIKLVLCKRNFICKGRYTKLGNKNCNKVASFPTMRNNRQKMTQMKLILVSREANCIIATADLEKEMAQNHQLTATHELLFGFEFLPG